jgi:hypothetical protein
MSLVPVGEPYSFPARAKGPQSLYPSVVNLVGSPIRMEWDRGSLDRLACDVLFARQ